MTNDSSREVVILGFAGSLRKGSFNKALLRAAVELCPPGARIVPHAIGDLPLYDADIDGDTKPEPVTRLKTAIAAADGVLYVSPEYNYGVPGVLKNAIDWASRPGYRSVLAQKPSAIIGASESIVGAARGQGQLKQEERRRLNKRAVVVGLLVFAALFSAYSGATRGRPHCAPSFWTWLRFHGEPGGELECAEAVGSQIFVLENDRLTPVNPERERAGIRPGY